MTTYRIISATSMGNDCPPLMVSLAFPAFDGWPCELSGDGKACTVVAPEPQEPVDLGPLVRVEEISDQ